LTVDEFEEAQANLKAPGMTGWWEHIIPKLTDQQAGSLRSAALSRSISHRAISIVLGQWGHTISPAQVGHWRRTHVV